MNPFDERLYTESVEDNIFISELNSNQVLLALTIMNDGVPVPTYVTSTKIEGTKRDYLTEYYPKQDNTGYNPNIYFIAYSVAILTSQQHILAGASNNPSFYTIVKEIQPDRLYTIQQGIIAIREEQFKEIKAQPQEDNNTPAKVIKNYFLVKRNPKQAGKWSTNPEYLISLVKPSEIKIPTILDNYQQAQEQSDNKLKTKLQPIQDQFQQYQQDLHKQYADMRKEIEDRLASQPERSYGSAHGDALDKAFRDSQPTDDYRIAKWS